MNQAKRYWTRKKIDQSWDIIIIGAGMAGLTAGAALALEGYKVLVLEQHYIPGGFTHSWKEHGYTFDTGVHYLGHIKPGQFLYKPFHRLSGGKLCWTDMSPQYDRVILPNLQFDYCIGGKLRKNLIAQFPHEKEGIQEYFRRTYSIVSDGAKYQYALTKPEFDDDDRQNASLVAFQTVTKKVFDELFTDPDLKMLLTGQWGNLGVAAYRASLAIAIYNVNHYSHGAAYPSGGSITIASTFAETIATHGGCVRVQATVKEIDIQKGKVHGVLLENGEYIKCAKVISAVGVNPTINKLAQGVPQFDSIRHQIGKLPLSLGHFALNLGLKGDIRKIGLGAFNWWVLRDNDPYSEEWHFDQEKEIPPFVYLSIPSLKDECYDPGPEQKHSAQIITLVDGQKFYRWANEHHFHDYESQRKQNKLWLAQKEGWAKRMLAALEKYIPGFTASIDYMNLSTPFSTHYYTHHPYGSIYGLAAVPERFMIEELRPHTQVEGFYFSGVDIFVPGISGALLSGLMTVACLTGQDYFHLLDKD